MGTLPAYVDYAFTAVSVLEKDEEAQHAFAARWGGLGLTHFARALHEGEAHDQQVAAFALGHTGSAWARTLLLPFLHQEPPEVRWAAALMLGEMRAEGAFPVLLALLQEFLPPHPAVAYDWYDVQHIHAARILGSWGKHAAIPALRETFTCLWQGEEHTPAGEYSQVWWHYQDALAYALGQLGAFDSLKDVKMPQARARLSAVHMAMGYLHAEQTWQQDVLSILLHASSDQERTDFLTLVQAVLQEQMGLTQQEAASALDTYGDNYCARWESLIPD